jgi:hypothetical protein
MVYGKCGEGLGTLMSSDIHEVADYLLKIGLCLKVSNTTAVSFYPCQFQVMPYAASQITAT